MHDNALHLAKVCNMMICKPHAELANTLGSGIQAAVDGVTDAGTQKLCPCYQQHTCTQPKLCFVRCKGIATTGPWLGQEKLPKETPEVDLTWHNHTL